jgi:hypothetical protein
LLLLRDIFGKADTSVRTQDGEDPHHISLATILKLVDPPLWQLIVYSSARLDHYPSLVVKPPHPFVRGFSHILLLHKIQHPENSLRLARLILLGGGV